MPPTIQLPSAQINDDQKPLIAAFSEVSWAHVLGEMGWQVGDFHVRSHRTFINDADKQPVGHINTENDTFWAYKPSGDIPCSRELSKFDVYAISRFSGSVNATIEHIRSLGFEPKAKASAEPLIEPASQVAETAIADTMPPKRDLWAEAFPSEIPEKLRSLTDIAVEHQVRAIYKQPLHQLTTPIIGHDGKVSDVPTLQVAVEVMQFSVSVLAMQPEADKTIFLVTLRYKQAVGFYPLTAIKTEAERLRDLVARIVAPLAIEGSEESPLATMSGDQIRIRWVEKAEIHQVEDTDDVANIYATDLSPSLRSIRNAFFEAGNESPTIADLAAQEAK